MTDYKDFDYNPSTLQVERELAYMRDEKKSEEIDWQILRKREELRKRRVEWIAAASIAFVLVLLYWYFSGTPSWGLK